MLLLGFFCVLVEVFICLCCLSFCVWGGGEGERKTIKRLGNTKENLV